MVSLSVDVASSAPKTNAQSRTGKSDQASSGDGFGALVDGNVSNATTASLAEVAPSRNQPATRNEGSSGANDRKDQPSQKSVAAIDQPNEPVLAPTDVATVINLTIETPVAVAIDIGANVAAGILPVDGEAATVDASTKADATATVDPSAVQPVVTVLVAPVAAVPALAETIAIDAASAAPAEPIAIDAASTTTIPTIKTQEKPTPAPATATAPEQATEQAATTSPVVAAAVTKPQPAAVEQASIDADTDGVTASVETKAQASAELPGVETKPVATPDATEKPAAKVQVKAEGAAQPDAVTPARDPRPVHAATLETRLDSSLATNPSSTPTTPPPTLHNAATQPHTTANANLAPPPINASVQLASNIAVPVSGLAVNIAFNANAGRSRFEIRLDPAELGRIDVRLDVDRNGQVTSHLTVERPATLDLLRRDAPQLQRALEDAGLKTGDSGLQFSLRDQSHQQTGSDDRSSRGQPYRLVVDEMPALPAEAGRTYARLAAARGGVDIRI